MSKAKTAATYKHITPALLKKVDSVIEDAAKHTYSVSKVYDTFNAVMQKRDVPQTCSSCLRNRVRDLKKWYADYLKAQGKAAPATGEVTTGKPAATTEAGYEGKDGVVYETEELALDSFYVETFIILDGERRTVLDDNDQPATVIFTPGEEGAQFGKATDVQGNPAPAFVYEQNGKAYLVSGEEGNYTEVTGEPIAEVKEEPVAQYDDPGAEGFVAPGEGVTRYPMAEGLPFDFTPGEAAPNKGTVLMADGTKVKPGKYATAQGLEIAVQPGGKATIKEEDLT